MRTQLCMKTSQKHKQRVEFLLSALPRGFGYMNGGNYHHYTLICSANKLFRHFSRKKKNQEQEVSSAASHFLSAAGHDTDRVLSHYT